MPFSDKFVEDAGREIKVSSIDADFEIAKKYIYNALEKSALVSDAFDVKDVEMYLRGSYANGTNIYFPNKLEIMVELKRTHEYDPDEEYNPEDPKIIDNYFIRDLGLNFSPENFTEQIYHSLFEQAGEHVEFTGKTIVINPIGKLKHAVEIYCGFSFNFVDENKKVNPGVIIHNDKFNHQTITFPRIHSKNLQVKDAATDGLYRRCVRFFKSIDIIYDREYGAYDVEQEFQSNATGYFIECLLYNVPNKMFTTNRGGFTEIVYKVLNYLNNCNLDDFVCTNEVWTLFNGLDGFWSIRGAKIFLKRVTHLYNIFPASREFLA